MAFRRWRHLLIFVCSLAFVELAGYWINQELTRPRPYGVPIIAGWAGYSAPALPAGILTTLLIGIAYCLVVPGRPRSCAKAAIAVVVTVFCLACLYLAVDHVDDLLLGVALGVAIPVSAFRFFTPNEVIPVAYRRGNTAHVDVTGARGEAIRQGMRDQLGLTVTGITPVGLASSAGSTPLRLRAEGGPQEYLFAKLYTKGHVRADRWYKIWRTILYGSLEDEHPFQTVRRLAEYEDYALRLLQDAGIAVPRPYGIVEITPEREYLLVTEFFDGAGGNRGRRHRRAADRPGSAADPRFCGTRGSPRSRHQAGQPDGPRRQTAADRRGLRPGAPLARGAGRRPGQHDAGPGGPHRPAERAYRQRMKSSTEAELAQAFAATRGVASLIRSRAPVHPTSTPRTCSPSSARSLRTSGPVVLQRWSLRRVSGAAAVARRHRRGHLCRPHLGHPGPQPGGAGARMRHGPCDDPVGPGGSLGGPAALHRGAPVGLDRARHRRRDRQRAGQLLAGTPVRPVHRRRRHHPDRHLRHLGGAQQIRHPDQAGTRRVERRASAWPGPPPTLRYDTFSGRLRHLPVPLRALAHPRLWLLLLTARCPSCRGSALVVPRPAHRDPGPAPASALHGRVDPACDCLSVG